MTTPTNAASAAGTPLPRAHDSEPELRGFRFASTPLPHAAGVYALTRRIADLIYPVLISESEDIAADAAAVEAREAAAMKVIDGQLWMARPQARQRMQIVRDLIGVYNPPLNVDHRTRHAAPELAALVPDRAENDPALARPTDLAADLSLSEADLDRLVRHFYARATKDELIGPVFGRAVADWEHHFETIRGFWSKTLLGTQRYTGNPFSAHISLDLRPEFFDRWLDLFRLTARDELPRAAADRAIAKVEHMSSCFQAGLFLPSPREPAQIPA
ncbi:group III truncated hemoglobin [Bradyrhizobium sp.]|uniref:group III truncated hemoglobin n=1 Tax=Bradyrhizobium sp. TaxID=376 RepID=UPI003C4DCB65